MISTILRNLLNNALKFTSQGGEIHMNASVQGDRVFVEVRDTGVGMTAKVRESLFQVDKKKSPQQYGTEYERGSGLGLILCQEFLRYHEGVMEVESEPGQGSRFWFSLPLGQEPQVKLEPSTIQGAAHHAGLRVLLVDDNPLHLRIGGLILKDLGMQYETANNGQEALARFQKEGFDVVLMDIDMPIMNGVESNLAIRETSQDLPPLIIALSSNTKAELTQLALAVPFDGYLSKPLDADKLHLILQNHLPA